MHCKIMSRDRMYTQGWICWPRMVINRVSPLIIKNMAKMYVNGPQKWDDSFKLMFIPKNVHYFADCQVRILQ
jgi:hypothetical protein